MFSRLISSSKSRAFEINSSGSARSSFKAVAVSRAVPLFLIPVVVTTPYPVVKQSTQVTVLVREAGASSEPAETALEHKIRVQF